MSELSASAPLLLPQLLIQAFGSLIDDLRQHLVRHGYEDIRTTHVINVFRFMDCDGTRPTTLAQRAGITPQAMSELLGHLERRGYVRRVPDPADGRGRIVVYAERGTSAAQVSTDFFADMERRWQQTNDAREIEVAKDLLSRVITGGGNASESA